MPNQLKSFGCRFLFTSALMAALFSASLAKTSSSVVSWRVVPDGVIFQLSNGDLRVQVWTKRTIRVTFERRKWAHDSPGVGIISSPQPVHWHLVLRSKYFNVSTGTVQVEVSKENGAIRFLNSEGIPILGETPGGRTMSLEAIPGKTQKATYRSELSFALPPNEDLYGLGQHRLPTSQGSISYRGTSVALEQANREVAIPFITSSRGYGLLWNNAARTDVSIGSGPADPVPPRQLLTDNGLPGGLTARYFDGHDLGKLVTTRIDPQIDFHWSGAPAEGLKHDYFSARWTGSVLAQESGNYTFVTTSDDGVRLWVDDKLLIDDWSNHAARDDTATVQFQAHSLHKIRMEYFQDTRDAIARLAWRHGSNQSVTWKSEVANNIDYFFIDGPNLDQVIAELRGLTGYAPMPPKWALGYWQSKERYSSQQEWLDIAQTYRAKDEPIDGLVQDFLYWEPYPWGSNAFDPRRYPDPATAIAQLHDRYHLHFMISVWGKFYPGSPDNPDRNYDEMNRRGYLFPAQPDSGRYYDAFNPASRALYWSFLRDQLFSIGVDAWWLDASEPEVDMQSYRQVQTAQGPASYRLNAWPLMHTTGVYEGQRATSSGKRVFILTRSAYTGQQRNGAATWSGDITGDWDTFARQVPAGLHFCLSGIPYWTTDIGGFFVNYPGGSENPEYRELFTRWFEWGAFCPIFRVHGTNTPKELWRFGPQFEPILATYDKLRYRLMPYIYSDAWQVTAHAGTMMRALVMDFPSDVTARESRDEFLFGPALLVCPVTQKGAISRPVYLPTGSEWIDFWTGKAFRGGQVITSPAPIAKMPLYVRSGSIIPMGPEIQYVDQEPLDEIELRVYRGASGAFTLYEDEGDNYGYEKGNYSTIPIAWNERTRTLTIGDRRGAFAGMLPKRNIRIVWVGPGKGTGVELIRTADQVVSYIGKSIVIKP